MSLLADAIAESNRRASDFDAALANGYPREFTKAPLIYELLGRGTLGMGPGYGRYSQTRNHHAEQYAQFRGHPYSIIKTIANRIARQSVQVARVCPVGYTGRKELRPTSSLLPGHLKMIQSRLEIIQDHPIELNLRNPNRLMVAWSLWFNTAASLEITGKAHWLVTPSEDPERRFDYWPIPSHCIEPIHQPNELFAGWRLFSPAGVNPIEVDNDAIVPFWLPDPADPLSAKSPMQSLSTAVMADYALEMSQRKSFENGANPGLAFITGKLPGFGGSAAPGVAGTNPGGRMTLKKDEREKVRDWVMQEYGGFLKDNRPIILDDFLQDVKKITNSPREMDYLNSGALTRDRVSQGWGVSPASLGAIENLSRAASAVADDHLIGNVVNPRIQFISETMTCYVPPRYNAAGFVVYLTPAKSEDAELDHTVRMDLADRCMISSNEVRAEYGKGPIEGGDGVFVPGGLQWVDVNPKITKGSGKSKGRKSASKIGLERVEKSGRTAGVSRTAGKREDAKALWTESRDLIRSSLLEWIRGRVDKTLAEVPLEFDARVKDFESQARSIADRLIPSRASTEVHAELFAASSDAVVRTMGRAAGDELDIVKAHQRERRAAGDQLAEDGIAERLAGSVAGALAKIANVGVRVLAGAKKRLREAIVAAMAAFWTEPAKAAEAVGSAVMATMEQAANRVANTVTTGAVETGRDAVRAAASVGGVKVQKVWHTQRDNRVRHAHDAADGQIVDSGEDFIVGGERCQYPGDEGLSDENRINCRCFTRTIYRG